MIRDDDAASLGRNVVDALDRGTKVGLVQEFDGWLHAPLEARIEPEIIEVLGAIAQRRAAPLARDEVLRRGWHGFELGRRSRARLGERARATLGAGCRRLLGLASGVAEVALPNQPVET